MPRVPKCDVCGKPARRGVQVGDMYACRPCLEEAEKSLEQPIPGCDEPVRKPKTTFTERLKESENDVPHMIIEARAGTGKTTTLIEGLKIVRAGSTNLTPSDQQQAIWDCLQRSPSNSTACFVAFNKSIATELQNRVPSGCTAMTMHSMGFKAIQQTFGRLRVNKYRMPDIICGLTGRDLRELRKHDMDLLKATESLVGLCKMNLVEPTSENLWELASYYDVDLNGQSGRIFSLVPSVLEQCKNVTADRCIDFNDMIWLTVALDLAVARYDILLVDECQDLNRCQQQLALKAGRRLVLCGDPKQAIYGFAGADAESMNRMQAILESSDRGCLHFPLTVTRRCSKAVVAKAQEIVPDFEAWKDNPEGKIGEASFTGKTKNQPNYMEQVEDGDMVLCRVNAPLVSQCFRFLKEGRKANIQGRDVGQGLINTINKMKALDIPDLTGKLSDWLHLETVKETKKRNPNENKLIALKDRVNCINCFMEGCVTVTEVTEKIEAVFTDDRESPGVKLSSIHKAKGLEANKVFLLLGKDASIPHPMAKSDWARAQELNILYVGITRAREMLVYVR